MGIDRREFVGLTIAGAAGVLGSACQQAAAPVAPPAGGEAATGQTAAVLTPLLPPVGKYFLQVNLKGLMAFLRVQAQNPKYGINAGLVKAMGGHPAHHPELWIHESNLVDPMDPAPDRWEGPNLDVAVWNLAGYVLDVSGVSSIHGAADLDVHRNNGTATPKPNGCRDNSMGAKGWNNLAHVPDMKALLKSSTGENRDVKLDPAVYTKDGALNAWVQLRVGSIEHKDDDDRRLGNQGYEFVTKSAGGSISYPTYPLLSPMKDVVRYLAAADEGTHCGISFTEIGASTPAFTIRLKQSAAGQRRVTCTVSNDPRGTTAPADGVNEHFRAIYNVLEPGTRPAEYARVVPKLKTAVCYSTDNGTGCGGIDFPG